MRKDDRLTKPQQYLLVYSKGSSWASNLIVMKALPNGLSSSRYGISVSKRVGKAVVRNRVKRLLREILRIESVESGWDIVFIVRPAAAEANYASVKKSVIDLLAQADLLKIERDGLLSEN